MIPVKSLDINTATAVQHHLDELERANHSPVTITSRRQLLLMVDQWLQEHHECELVDADTTQLKAWQAWLMNTTYGRDGRKRRLSTLLAYTSHLRMFFQWCRWNGIRTDNPAEGLTMPRLPEPPPRNFDENNLALAIRCAPDYPATPIKAWLALSGWAALRAGECARILREDIQDCGDYTLLLVRGKGGHGEVTRKIPLSHELLLILGPWMSSSRSRNGPLFYRRIRHYGSRPTRTRAYTPREVSNLVAAYLKGLGMRETMHWGRHRAVTRAIIDGHRPTVVQKLTGHATLRSLQRYIHEADTDVIALAETLGVNLGNVLGRQFRVVRDDDTHPSTGDPT